MRLRILAAVALASLLAAAIASVFAGRDAAARRAELAADHRLAPARQGPVEFGSWGSGPPVLVVHGAGGGFDQGRLIAEAFLGDGFAVVAPSRFGYLGSALPEDPSTRAQAEAFADLLDALRLERVAVVAFSGGVPPALKFAELHPERVSALVVLSSAPFTPHAPPTDKRPMPDWLYQALFGADVVYWSLAKVAADALGEAFDARAEFRAELDAAERQFVDRLVDSFLPASDRLAGVMNEGAAIDPSANYEIERIAAPILAVHARDDRLNDFTVAEEIVRRAPCAELLALDRGGHLLLGAHRDVRARVAAFLAEPPTPDRKSRCAPQERQPLRRPFGARIPEPYEA